MIQLLSSSSTAVPPPPLLARAGGRQEAAGPHRRRLRSQSPPPMPVMVNGSLAHNASREELLVNAMLLLPLRPDVSGWILCDPNPCPRMMRGEECRGFKRSARIRAPQLCQLRALRFHADHTPIAFFGTSARSQTRGRDSLWFRLCVPLAWTVSLSALQFIIHIRGQLPPASSSPSGALGTPLMTSRCHQPGRRGGCESVERLEAQLVDGDAKL